MAMLAASGHDVLAASALIFSMQLSLMLTGMSFLFSTGILAGRAYGAQDKALACGYLQQAWFCSLLIAIPLMLLFWNAGKVLIFLGQSPQVAALANSYFHSYIWAVVPALLATSTMHFAYGIQQKKLIRALFMVS